MCMDFSAFEFTRSMALATLTMHVVTYIRRNRASCLIPYLSHVPSYRQGHEDQMSQSQMYMLTICMWTYRSGFTRPFDMDVQYTRIQDSIECYMPPSDSTDTP